jgi:hypothetical protein
MFGRYDTEQAHNADSRFGASMLDAILSCVILVKNEH